MSDAAGADLSYAGYLALDRLLGAQRCAGDDDELLFVIVHQTKELWLRQIIAELLRLKPMVRAGALLEAYKGLARISRIQAVMAASWDVLATMTPPDYLAFRARLGSSSGFQSAQFRTFEYLLGCRARPPLAPGDAADDGALHHAMLSAWTGPSLWDDANAALAQAGLLETPLAARAASQSPAGDLRVEAAWSRVYADTHAWWDFYQLAEKLVDIDEALGAWRHRHALTVARIIGTRPGTGGSSGVAYLESTLARRCFPELWALRASL